MGPGVIDDKEHSTTAQKRDAVSAGLSESSVSKKTKRIHSSNKNNSIIGDSIEQEASPSDLNNNTVFEEVMQDFMKIDDNVKTCKVLLMSSLSCIQF